MKLSKLSQFVLVSATGLLLATTLTACNIVTIDYVYVAASSGQSAGSTGQIYTYAVDAESGALRSVQKTVSTGGNSPIAMAVSGDYENLYVANQGNNSVVHFAIATDGTLTQKDTVTASGVPVAIAIAPNGSYLYVLTGSTSATLTEYALSSGTIGSAMAVEPLRLNCTNTSSDFPADTIVPTAVTVLANSGAVYATAFDQSAYNPGGTVTSSANPGWVFGFAVGSGGALSAPAKNCSGGDAYDVYQSGVKPSGVAADPTNRFVYVTDFASNELIGYTIQSGNALNFMLNGPFKTGNEPSAIVIDPRGIYIYVPDSLDSTVTSYTITLATGSPSVSVASSGSSANVTDTEPVAITIDPALGRFVYTANHLGNSISGFRLNPNTGVLTLAQATPFPTGASPTAVVAVPHGNHAVQVVTP
jgi:6-phosphogluconolactonase (cycloisomerase 2 family)